MWYFHIGGILHCPDILTALERMIFYYAAVSIIRGAKEWNVIVLVSKE